MMAELPKRKNKASSRGLLGNYRYLSRKAMLMCALQSTRARKKHHQKMMVPNRQTKRPGSPHGPLEPDVLKKRSKLSDTNLENQSCLSSDSSGGDAGDHGGDAGDHGGDAGDHGLSASVPDHHTLMTALRDSWEVDSGFCSEASPPASGRSSPCPAARLTSVVALDCEMVGTGLRGQTSELARCSILDYHGNILYDEYVRPCEPVTDFRTRWSGIRRHHLQNATPFAQAREEVLGILQGKVVVGHSIYNDFEALHILHPGHMVRDTCTTRLFGRLARFPRQRFLSLKILSSKLLGRRIQAGRKGHCSVEDARAALDLYKLVEGEWEEELQSRLGDHDGPRPPGFAPSDHYMQDEYWPDDVIADGQ